MPRITPVHYRRLICVFEKAGFQYDRTKGDHLIYGKSGIIRPLVIPMYGQVNLFIIENLLKTAKMSRDRYFQLLAEC